MTILEEAAEVVVDCAVPLETLYLCCMDDPNLSPELKEGIKKAVMRSRLFIHKYKRHRQEKKVLSNWSK